MSLLSAVLWVLSNIWPCEISAKGGKCSEKTKAGRTGLHLNRMNMKGFTKGNTRAKVLKDRGWVLPITGENHPTWKNICKCPGAEACLVQNNKEVAAAKAEWKEVTGTQTEYGLVGNYRDLFSGRSDFIWNILESLTAELRTEQGMGKGKDGNRKTSLEALWGCLGPLVAMKVGRNSHIPYVFWR